MSAQCSFKYLWDGALMEGWGKRVHHRPPWGDQFRLKGLYLYYHEGIKIWIIKKENSQSILVLVVRQRHHASRLLSSCKSPIVVMFTYDDSGNTADGVFAMELAPYLLEHCNKTPCSGMPFRQMWVPQTCQVWYLADSSPTIGQLLVDSWLTIIVPTVGRQTTDSRLTSDLVCYSTLHYYLW